MKIKNTKTDILLNIAAVACLAAVTLYLLVRWSQIPMTIPGHYTAAPPCGSCRCWGGCCMC